MFIEALVTVANLQNWPKCPLSDEETSVCPTGCH